MDGILEALAFALLIGGQFLAVIVTSISKATLADAGERRPGTALPDGPETRGNQSRDPLPLAGERAIP